MTDIEHGPAQARRLLWAQDGIVHVRLRGAERADHARLQAALAHRVGSLAGVLWAYAAPLTDLVVAAVDGDDGLAELLEAVALVEAEHGDPLQEFGGDHPGESRSFRRQVLGLGADAVALTAGITGRALRLARVPIEATAPLALLDSVPWLRSHLEGLVGRPATDVGLGLASATAAGLTQGVSGVLADIGHRAALASEARARQRAWESYAPLLHDVGGAPSAPGPVGPESAGATRDEQDPDDDLRGPVEQVSAALSATSLAASGISLAGARSARMAARMLLAGLPRAAIRGRDVFAARTAALLGARGGLVLHPDALRLLDRIDTVVVDTRMLLTGTWALGTVEPLREIGPRVRLKPYDRVARMLDLSDAERTVRQAGWRLEPLSRDVVLPRGGVAAVRRLRRGGRSVLLLTERGEPVALAAVRPRRDPHATALLSTARDAGLDLLLAGRPHPCLGDLPSDGTVPGGDRLPGAIRRLRSEGAGVAVVSGDPAAVKAAHLGIGTVRDAQEVPWAADVLSVTGLEPAALLLGSCAAARATSQRSAALAAGGSVVGGALALTGQNGHRSGGYRAVGAVNVAALTAMASAAWSAAGIAHRHVPATPEEHPWHSLPPGEALSRLLTSRHGLGEHEAERRQDDASGDGEHHPPSLVGALGEELANPLTPLLVGAAALSATIGSLLDGGLVGGVLGGNALVGAWQRLHTERGIAHLLSNAAGRARVLRGGQEGEVESASLVPGDVLLLQAGDAVPADGRLLEAEMLEVDESSLTGESLPVAKSVAPVPDVPLADRCCMVYAGTTVASGRGAAVVVGVGHATAAARAASVDQQSRSPGGVEVRLAQLTASTLRLAAGGGAALGLTGLLRGVPMDSVLGSAVNLAIAAIPEGLPILASMAQLAAADRLSKRGTLVRAPATIEALGRVDVLCVDKTGTLTEGRIRLRLLADARGEEHTDTGLGPARRDVLAVALRATPAAPRLADLPHATDRAVVRGARAEGVEATEGLPGWERVAELPFEPARGYHATLGRHEGRALVSIKGAPEVVLPRCTSERNGSRGRRLDARARRARLDRVTRWARQGLRVLAVAEGEHPTGEGVDPDRLKGLRLAGFLAFADRVRPAARAAVEGARQAGVDVIMITGDHPTTAQAIAAELGLLDGDGVCTGADLDRMPDERLTTEVARTRVFARVTPAQKVRIVQALQRSGRVVAMAGDGANDAPAIALADAGIALGGSRSAPAAREVADMVVTDDRIETVIDALAEGRGLWASVHDALAILIGGNLGEIAYTLLGGLLSRTPVLNPRQLLLVNLLTDLAPAMVIAVRPPADLSPEDLLLEGPEASLGEALSTDIVSRAASTAAGAVAAYVGGRLTGTQTRARTIGLVALVGSQLGQTLVTGGRHPSVLAASGLSAAALVTVVQTPGLSRHFGCRPMGPVGWSIGLGAAAAATGASVLAPGLVQRLAEAVEEEVVTEAT